MNRTMILSVLLVAALLTGCGSKSSNSTSSTSSSLSALTVASSNQQTTISWVKGAASKATSYNLYWSTSPGVTIGTGAKIANVTSPYIHSGLANGVMNYYVITEITNGVEGVESLEVGAAPKADIPVPPSGITISPLDSSLKLAIVRTAATTTAKYNVYWSLESDMVSTKIVNAFGSGSSFLHTGLANGKRYYYALTVETPDGESAKSPTIMAVPIADIPAVDYVKGVSEAAIAAPTAVSATAKNQTVTISWNMPAKSVPTIFDPASTPIQTPVLLTPLVQIPVISSYIIYWSKEYITNAGQVDSIPVSVTSKTKLPFTFDHNTDLTNNIPFYYAVKAVSATDAAGALLKRADGTLITPFESALSSQVAVVPAIRISAPPSGLTATSGSQQISLKWNKDASAGAYYKIYVSNTPPQKPEDLLLQGKPITVTTPSYTHTGLQTGKPYYYVVTTVDEAESAPSALVAFSLR